MCATRAGQTGMNQDSLNQMAEKSFVGPKKKILLLDAERANAPNWPEGTAARGFKLK